ncbi:sensor histidine kinase [Polaribacter sp. AHE13PA]|uniref:sensor histidine kinase n=1 Tax=Polaribacter sp. AHE13PA TaxID=2745562 RepID=UPI001C4F501D|nr:ATP-binding protein [Polaribacter sp. AHE13PA]QXP68391.1 hypothetical protein H0I28_07810 [Polaribacter sp. AHE13PA]
MKHVKVTFLLFLLLAFLSCGKEVEKEKNLNKEPEIKVLLKTPNYKKLDDVEKLKFSKKIAKEMKLEVSDKYLIYNNISYLYGKLPKIDSAIVFTKKMLNLPNVIESDKLKGKVFFKLGNYFNRINLKDSAYFYYSNSKEYFLKTQDSVYISNALINLAILESDFGSYSSSDSTAVQALKFLKSNNGSLKAKVFNCMAINSKKQSLYKEAISYYNKSILISKSKSSKIIYKNNVANVFKEQKEYSKSILILEDLLKDTITHQKTKARIIDNLAHTKWLNDASSAVLKELLLAKSIRNTEKDNYGLIASYSHLSEFFNKKDNTKSLFYASEMYKIAKREKSPQDLLEAIDKIVNFQSPQKSIKYYKESIRLRDSLQEAEIKRQYKFAKIKYNYEEEEKQKQKFKTLATENKLVAEQEYSDKKNIFILGILLTSGLLILIYRRKYQYKKRILQENYNTETRIAKKLHDELGNDIFNTLTKVQNPKINTEEIINDLDKIYLQTRAISHENDSIETGLDFENYFRNLVASYNSDSCKIILKDLSCLNLNNLTKEKQIVIYRVFNELFVNMKKHSKASLVVLACKKTNHNLEISYADNGIGFKENTVIFKNGLKNMETRIKTIKGTINFENKPNKGVKVKIHFKN